MTAISNQSLALSLAGHGLAVFPCNPASKRPITQHGFRDSTTDRDTIARWWLRHPEAMPGLPMSNWWVLDLDAGAPAEIARHRVADLIERCGLVVRTPGGGLHLYYSRVPGVAVRNAQSDIAPNVDTRGHDSTGCSLGYVVAPGAVNSAGARYQIVRGNYSRIVPAPRWLTALAVFSASERGDIGKSRSLAAKLNAATATEWRAIFDAEMATRTRPAVSPSRGIAAQAHADLDNEARTLAERRDGRRHAMFAAGCRLARYVAHDVLTVEEIREALLPAWSVCGGRQKHGNRYAMSALARAFEKGRGDPLPPVMRKYRDAA